MHAWDTPTGIPFNVVNLHSLAAHNPSWTLRSSTLSEFGTQQMEMLTVSEILGDPSYGAKAEAVIQYLHDKNEGKVRRGVCFFKRDPWGVQHVNKAIG